jgi:hypothetical protein
MDMSPQAELNQMTREQALDILNAINEATGRKDYAEAARLSRLFPLAPHLAKAVKDMYGKDYLLSLGYDLSEADAEYGAGWIDQ